MKAGPLIFAGLLALALVYRRRQLSDPARGLAMIAILALLTYGSGLVHPPSVETMIRDVTGTLGPYTYAVVGALAFLETGAGVGLVAPGELAVILGGVSAGQGEIELIPLVALVWACALAGDLTSFLLGRRLGREFLIRHGPKVGITPQRLEQVEKYFTAHGGKTIFIGRFVGLIRPLSPFIAGASKNAGAAVHSAHHARGRDLGGRVLRAGLLLLAFPGSADRAHQTRHLCPRRGDRARGRSYRDLPPPPRPVTTRSI